MKDTEMLALAKTTYKLMQKNNLEDDILKWLIQQAEKVEQLENHHEIQTKKWSLLHQEQQEEIQRLETELMMLR